MINFILIVIAIILSPVLIICALISTFLIACIIYAIAVSIAEGVKCSVKFLKKKD